MDSVAEVPLHCAVASASTDRSDLTGIPVQEYVESAGGTGFGS